MSSRTFGPPSEPRSSRASLDALDAQLDRPARLQMIVALILGLVLVAIPLYLWRRPRAESISVSAVAADASALPAVTAAPTIRRDDGLVLGEAKLLSCHDPGPKKTPPDRCDHVAEVGRALARAIEDSASCVAREAGGGTIVYVADVHFRKKSVTLSTPKEGRTLKSSKVAAGCRRSVQRKVAELELGSLEHEHTRYRVSVTATYPGAVKP